MNRFERCGLGDRVAGGLSRCAGDRGEAAGWGPGCGRGRLAAVLLRACHAGNAAGGIAVGGEYRARDGTLRGVREGRRIGKPPELRVPSLRRTGLRRAPGARDGDRGLRDYGRGGGSTDMTTRIVEL